MKLDNRNYEAQFEIGGHRAAWQQRPAVEAGPKRTGVWQERFRSRIQAEDLNWSTAISLRLIEHLLEMPSEAREGAVRDMVPTMDDAAIRALNAVLVLMIAKISEQAPGSMPNPATGARLEALLALRQLLSTLRNAPTPETADVRVEEATVMATCAPIDARFAVAAQRVSPGLANDAVVNELTQVLTAYRQVLTSTKGSDAAGSLLERKIATVLEFLARAQASLLRNKQAIASYEAAAAQYEKLGDQPSSADCRDRLTALAMQDRADVDAAQQRLLEALDRFPVGQDSLPHVQTLLDLAELLKQVGETFDVEQRLQQAVVELAKLGYPGPTTSTLEATLCQWIADIPDGQGQPGSNSFLRTFMTLVQVYTRIAGIRSVLALRAEPPQPGDAKEFQRLMEELGNVFNAATEEAARERRQLQDEIRPLGIPGFEPPENNEAVQVLRLMTDVAHRAEALTAESDRRSAAGESQADLLQPAVDLVVEAGTLGLPVVTVTAMLAQAEVFMNAGRTADSIKVLKNARSLVADLGGPTERATSVRVLTRLALAYVSLPDWHGCSETCGVAIDEIERDRYRVSAPYLQATYLRDRGLLYTMGVAAAYQLEDYETMLERAELSKAHTAARWTVHPPDPASTVADLHDQLLQASVDIDRARAAGAGAEAIAGLLAKRRRLWDMLSISRGAEIRPAATNLRQFSIGAVQAALDPEQAILYYYWAGTYSLLVVTLTSSGVQVERSDLSQDERHGLEELVGVIGSLTGSLAYLDTEIPKYGQVLLPAKTRQLLEGKRHVIISPHKLLHQFPFQALLFDGDLFIQRLAVSYVPNLSSLFIDHHPPAGTRVVAVGIDDFAVPGEELPTLPNAQRETDGIARAYARRGVPVRELIGPAATKQQLLRWAADGTLGSALCLHLATHGSNLQSDTPMESCLYLYDARLDGLDISEWTLRADIVVLSACDSGQRALGGRGMAELPGDDLFGLQAAFFQAGARCVLSSLWPADDAAAVQILTAFHEQLAAGATPEAALQAAQCVYMGQAPQLATSTYYWAPFFLLAVGQRKPQPVPSPNAALEEVAHG